MSVFVPRPVAVIPDAVKAGPTGPGAGVLMTEFLLPNILSNKPQEKMARAVALGREVAYVKKAEMVISGKIADPLLGVAWHLEDPDEETIDDSYKDPKAREAYALIARPQANLDPKQVGQVYSREAIWEITSRHMGLAGQGAWFFDGLNDFGIPTAICYIRPDRLTPKFDGQALDSWALDVKPGNPNGTRLELNEIALVQLETPDEGVFTGGLVEAALTKALLNGSIDKHFAQVLAGGGRLSGILSPKADPITDDGIYNQLTRDWRNVTEQPESARRLQVVRAPIDFTRTVATMDELKLIDLMSRNRDDLLAIWGVPLSQIGGYSPAGLNSGDVRKYDEAALWMNAVTPRLSKFSAVIQTCILDRFGPYLGWVPKIVFDIPTFDDDSPRYDKVQKSQFVALTENERRAQLGFDPLPDDRIGPTGVPMGEEIWRPNTQSPVGVPPTPEPTIVAQGLQAPSWSAYQPTAPSPSAVAQGAAPIQGAPASTKPAKAKPVDGPDVIPAVLAALKKQWPESELDIVKQGTWTFDPAFPMKKINAARRPIARNPKIVAGAEAVLAIGAPIAPVTLIHTKRIGKPGYEPIDGWHRVLAAEHQGLKKIPAYVGEGDDAWTQNLIAFDDDIPTPPDSAQDEEPAGEGKASVREGMTALRSRLQGQFTPKVQGAVRQILTDQKRDIAERVRTKYDAIKRKPADTTIWWPADARWDTAMAQAMRPSLASMAGMVSDHVKQQLKSSGKAGTLAPAGAVAHVLTRGAARVTKINETTRQGIADLVAQGIEEGLSPAELGDSIEAWSGFDEYRAEMIARTETMDAYNAAALGSYDELGVSMVEAIDGDEDEECAARDGQTFTLDEADSIEDHPNGSLDWVPVVDYGSMG